MSIKIRSKLCSERGASFSMALLLLLVCTVVSSIVLAASTAMVGVVTQQGKSDQRYYSVTSATGLLTNWMEDNEVQVNAMQTRNLEDETDVEVNAVLDGDSVEGHAFNELLMLATNYALFGTPDTDEAETELSGLDDGAWLEPFENGMWGDPGITPEDTLSLKATITPEKKTVPSGADEFNLQVEVEGKLTQNWELYLVFKNKVNDPVADATDQYQVLVTLHGNVDSFPRDNEGENELGLKSVVSWSLAGIEPGKGMPS